MKGKAIAILMTTLVLFTGIASAYDEASPYTITLRWIIPEDTTFTVEIRGGGATIDFNPASKTETFVEPDNQDDSQELSILNVTNAGNLALSFYHNATTPIWANLTVSKTNESSAGVTLKDTQVVLNLSVAIGNHIDVYMWTNVTEAVSGTTEGTYQINSTSGA